MRASVLSTVALIGAFTAGLAQTQATPPPSASHAMPPDQLAAVHHALREFDRFLDHHPLLEYELRQEPALVRDGRFLHKNCELSEFFADNPQVVPGLQYYPRYF